MHGEIQAWRACDALSAAVARASGRPENNPAWRFDGARWYDAALAYEAACARYFYFAPSCPKDRPGCKLYLHKARMATHVDQWLAWYPQDQVAVVNASHLYADPAPVLHDVATFAGLAPSAVAAALRGPVTGKTCWHACHAKKRPLAIAPALRDKIEALIAPERARLTVFLEALDPARVSE